MTGHGLSRTTEHVLALAPDAASRKAGDRLSGPGQWAETGTADDAVWGRCTGSGGKEYRTVVDLCGPGYRCSCPSRKFPCKHALGLLLLWAGEPGVPGAPEPPSWAAQWLTNRRRRTKGAAPSEASKISERGRTPADPEAARRRGQRRLQRIAAGAGELESRLADLLRDGLAGADRSGYALWDETAARMVDAQAPGLAARVRELGSVPASGPGWPARLLAECALLHLLDRAILTLDNLPEPLAATVRTRAGITVDTAELLAAPDALVRDRWLVLGRQDSEEGRLTVRRFWLHGQQTRRPALLLVFSAVGGDPELALPVGSAFEADLAYYPAARPLRAALGERRSTPQPAGEPTGTGVADALAEYGTAVCDDPWLDSVPVVLSGAVVLPGNGTETGWQLAEASGDAALPISPATGRSSLWRLAAISGGGPLTVFGECGHQGFSPHTAWDEAGTAVPL